MTPWSQMGWVEAVIHVVAFWALIRYAIGFIVSESRQVRPGKTRAPNPHHSCRRWDSHETEPASRHIP